MVYSESRAIREVVLEYLVEELHLNRARVTFLGEPLNCVIVVRDVLNYPDLVDQNTVALVCA